MEGESRAAHVAKVSFAKRASVHQGHEHQRGPIVERSTLLKEVETDLATLLEDVNNLDDLEAQFDGSDAGKRFTETWKYARLMWAPGTTPTAAHRPRQRRNQTRNPGRRKTPN